VTASPALSARGLIRGFSGRIAVDGVDLEVAFGERVALLGPNGAGKSTLLRLAATLLRPDAGDLRVCGHPCPEAAHRVRGRLGLLGHDPMVYRDLSARQNLEFFARLHGLDRPGRRALDALDGVGLLVRADDPVRTFSRGMAQRLGLARALMPDPELLLLDEPHAGLDAAGAEMLDRTLREGPPGRAVVLVTHDLHRALELCGRAVVLRGGRVVEDAPTAGVDPVAFRSRYAELVGAEGPR
jgi:heme exporter protein A